MSEDMVLSIYRGDKTGGEEVRYTVPLTPGMVVLDAVHYVQAHEAQDLAVRWNCKAAHCGSCGAEINGRPKLLCKTRLDDYQGQVVHIQPMQTFPIIKDLVSDVSWNYETAKKIPAFQLSQSAPLQMQQFDVDRVQEFHHCIECFLCQDTCHVLRDHDAKDQYFGPRFMVKIAEFEMHPRETGDRVSMLSKEAGLSMCNVTKCCTEVCPQHIKITDNAIIPLKERVADQYWDPLRALLRRKKPKAGQDIEPGTAVRG